MVEDAVVAQWVVVTDVLRNKYNMAMTPASSSAPPTATPTASPPATADKDTIPKTLPGNVYTKLVNDYNKIQLDGEDRNFPEKMLLGAEKALARMYHEHHITNHYTATPLGEIMSQRTLTALGTIDANRKKENVDKQLIIDSKSNISTSTARRSAYIDIASGSRV